MEALKADYAAKPSTYFEEARPEMLPYVPETCRRAMDVGCGDGSFGALLRQQRRVEVWGVEPFEPAATEAAKKLDKVICGGFGSPLGLPDAAFDCVTFNDVLEHLIEPLVALEEAKRLLAPGGVIVASIPNIRHFPTIWRLVIHGEWKYRDCGTLDKTHMRFYTRSSIVELFKEGGFIVDHIEGIHPFRGVPNATARTWKLYKLINALSCGKFDELKFERYVVVARSH